ncbi:MAG TPA: protein translocase subunit SecD [Gaiellaceae bacterium]
MRRYVWILLALGAALAGVVVLAVFRSPTLGLDLQGGLELVLQAQPPPGQTLSQDDLDRSVEIIRNRVDKLGVSEPEIRKQGSDQIAIDLAGVHNPARAAQIVGKTAQLQFYDLEADLVPGKSIDASGNPIPNGRLRPLLTPEDKLTGTPSQWFLFSKDGKLLAGPTERKSQLAQTLENGEIPEGSKVYGTPQGQLLVSCGPPTVVCPGVNASPPPQTYYYLFNYQPNDSEHPIPELTGQDLKLTGTRQDFQNGQPIVTLQFTGKGGDAFQKITRDLWQRGQLRGTAQHFAIVLDDEIRSWPQIDPTDSTLSNGIAGSSAIIEGLDSVQEAKDLALVLQTGALPVQFVQVERSDISATLGQESLHEALVAGIGGLIAVALFLLLFYRFLGLVAVLGLVIYGVLLYGGILIFNVTLTLAGFAGLILTIGVAADANVVIFERIKEEVKLGKSVRAAIGGGYAKGFRTIVDANVVTMITALVLFLAATGSVKGFALTLLIGTLVSMVTAVAATRALLGLLAGFSWFDNPAFMGASAQKIPAWQRIDFMAKRRVWFAISGVILLIGFVSLGVRGLNLGIDFEGGSQITFKTAQPTSVQKVRDEADKLGQSDAVVQGTGAESNGNFTQFRIQTESLSGPEQTTFQRSLVRDLGASSIGVKNVSATFSNQILRSAIIAIVVSLALIVAYIAIRFRGWRFAVPVLVALVHDIFITLGVYSLTGREVTASTVAAVLTILGYSIYDTIIIFDRVRENIPLMRRSSFAAIANQSLWETIRRSLATTFITLLPVSALLVFGGATLKDFAFALLVGIASGAYSTIFIATPLLTILKEREPDYAKRRQAGQLEKLAATEVPAETIAEEPPAAGAEPEPVAFDEDEGDGDREEEPVVAEGGAAAARREARRRRRRTRPHGRAR